MNLDCIQLTAAYLENEWRDETDFIDYFTSRYKLKFLFYFMEVSVAAFWTDEANCDGQTIN